MSLLRWCIAVSFCIGIVLILTVTKTLQIRSAIAYAQSFPEPSETVEAVISTHSQWRDKLNTVGEIVAMRSVNMHTEVAGTIDYVGFIAGSYVNEGDVLIRLDSAVESARLDAAKAEARLAQLDVQRYQRLIANKASSQDLYDRAKAQLDVAQSEIRALQAAIDKKTLRAPFSGNTSIHTWEKGAFLPANSRVTQLVGGLDSLWLEFTLPQYEEALPIGSEVFVTVAAEPASAAIIGKVIAANSGFSRDSRHIQYRASITNTKQALRPGEMVRVSLARGPVIDVVKLPMTAIRRDSFGTYVYVLVDQEGSLRAKRREVQVKAELDNTAIISSGLQLQDLVATKGSFKLREHLKVFVKNPSNDLALITPTAEVNTQ